MITYLYGNHGPVYFPFRLKAGRAPGACQLGGAPPQGVIPPQVETATRYLATLRLNEECDVSLFTTFDFTNRSLSGYFNATYRLLDQSNPLVQFVVHSSIADREKSSGLSSDLPELHFVFGRSGVDPECLSAEGLENPAIYEEHKVGGQPFFEQLEGDFAKTLDLFQQGYIHLLQLAFPGEEDAEIDADWPFGPSVFHVFCHQVGLSFQFCYIWG